MTPEQLEDLLEELDGIDGRAQRMALQRLEEGHRPDLATEAEPVARRLAEIADALKSEAPAARKQRSSQISESTVDLQYVMGRTRYTSLRIGRRIRERQRGG